MPFPCEVEKFLSIQAQDFIEEDVHGARIKDNATFLSIQAQDFIEETSPTPADTTNASKFLSIQAQDFIEEPPSRRVPVRCSRIPEHSSSGLH